jgi:Na+-driven multidrug efflux pump
MICVAVFIFSLGSPFFNAVSGTGATRISLAVELITLTTYMSYILLTAGYYKLPLTAVWGSEIVYMMTLFFLSFFYMRSGRWKFIKL